MVAVAAEIPGICLQNLETHPIRDRIEECLRIALKQSRRSSVKYSSKIRPGIEMYNNFFELFGEVVCEEFNGTWDPLYNQLRVILPESVLGAQCRMLLTRGRKTEHGYFRVWPKRTLSKNLVRQNFRNYPTTVPLPLWDEDEALPTVPMDSLPNFWIVYDVNGQDVFEAYIAFPAHLNKSGTRLVYTDSRSLFRGQVGSLRTKDPEQGKPIEVFVKERSGTIA
jgi:hypothetical protein